MDMYNPVGFIFADHQPSPRPKSQSRSTYFPLRKVGVSKVGDAHYAASHKYIKFKTKTKLDN